MDSQRIDPEAHARLDGLMERCELSLYRFLCAILGNREAAQDCTQEAFVRAYEQLRRGKTVNPRFVYTVGYHRAMDEFRRHRKERVNEAALEQARAVDPTREVEIHEAWERLKPQERSLLYLVAVEEMTAPDIAEMLGISLNAAYMRVSRARAHLRDLLGDDDERS